MGMPNTSRLSGPKIRGGVIGRSGRMPKPAESEVPGPSSYQVALGSPRSRALLDAIAIVISEAVCDGSGKTRHVDL